MFSKGSDTSAWTSVLLALPVPEIVQYQEPGSRYAAAPSFLTAFSELKVPAPISAPWLGAVQRRLETSIATVNDPSDPAAITESIAGAAIAFFEATSDLLPGEPFLYPTSRGDVVAEFVGTRGRLTGILGSEGLLLHAVVDGKAVQQEARFEDNFNGIRQQLKGLKLKLQTEDHGSALGS